MSERTALNVAISNLRDDRWSLEDVKWYRPFLRRTRQEDFLASVVDALSLVQEELESLAPKKGKKR